MFWSGNYILVRELKCLLKEENVTLTQVLEADDILQECKADNKALIQFLTRPDILAELITLITEEPPKNVELSSQYRHANIASEVLTSNLSMLRDRLSMEATQMNRLCDFVNKDPPLNPLLASYFSKTIEMLLERSPKQDWYLHHIVCLHVLDMFKSRRDFLPNLLRHISTSAISDTFNCFLHLGSPFNKIILEWLDEHQFLESLIQIICGTYDHEEASSAPAGTSTTDEADAAHCDRLDANHNAESDDNAPLQTEEVHGGTRAAETNGETDTAEDGHAPEGGAAGDEPSAADREARAERLRGVAAANAASLLCDIAADASAADPLNNEWYAGRAVAARLRGEDAVRRLLQGVFTSPARARRPALVHACRLLLALLGAPAPADAAHDGAEAGEEAAVAHLGAVERAIAPHLPLLHHALLRPLEEEPSGCAAVGAARVAVATLLARLALSEVDDVPTALISLGTAGVLVDMLFQFPHNNFLHAQVCALVRNARANRRFSHRYTAHLIEECNLLTRLMDAFEENEDKGERGVRAGYMGHVVAVLRSLDAAPPVLPSALQQRWDAFCENKLRPLLQRHDTPLGGVVPWENMYEVGANIQVHMDSMADPLEDGYDFNETAASFDEGAEVCEPLAEPLADSADEARDQQMDRVQQNKTNHFLELLKTRRSMFDDELWDDAEPAPHALQHDSPWEGAGGGAGGGEEGWAQFEAFADSTPPANPFASIAPIGGSFWSPTSESQNQSDLETSSPNPPPSGSDDEYKDALTILLAQKMLTAFHNIPPEDAVAEGLAGFHLEDARAPQRTAEDSLHDEEHPASHDTEGHKDSNGENSQNVQEENSNVPNPPCNLLQENPVVQDTARNSSPDVIEVNPNVRNFPSNVLQGNPDELNFNLNNLEENANVQNSPTKSDETKSQDFGKVEPQSISPSGPSVPKGSPEGPESRAPPADR